MDEQLSRLEKIKQAREVCNKSLNVKEDRTKTTAKFDTERETVYTDSSQVNIKLLMIRSVIAVVLFLCFVVAFELELSYMGYSSNDAVEYIRSNALIDTAKEYVTTFLEQTKY